MDSFGKLILNSSSNPISTGFPSLNSDMVFLLNLYGFTCTLNSCLKYINIHALRHTSATLLINEVVHPKIISVRLGHSDIKTTTNVYGHVLKEADETASSKLDSILFNNSKTQ